VELAFYCPASEVPPGRATGARATLDFVSESLPRRRCPEVRNGDDDFDLHLPLAIALHRAAA